MGCLISAPTLLLCSWCLWLMLKWTEAGGSPWINHSFIGLCLCHSGCPLIGIDVSWGITYFKYVSIISSICFVLMNLCLCSPIISLSRNLANQSRYSLLFSSQVTSPLMLTQWVLLHGRIFPSSWCFRETLEWGCKLAEDYFLLTSTYWFK